MHLKPLHDNCRCWSRHMIQKNRLMHILRSYLVGSSIRIYELRSAAGRSTWYIHPPIIQLLINAPSSFISRCARFVPRSTLTRSASCVAAIFRARIAMASSLDNTNTASGHDAVFFINETAHDDAGRLGGRQFWRRISSAQINYRRRCR